MRTLTNHTASNVHIITMATPQSTTSANGAPAKKLEQITFRFCSECSNMLYPKEDEESHKLQFTCRTCQFTEPAQSTCVFRNVLNNSAGETAGVTQDVGSDPTVSDHEAIPIFCICCGFVILCDTCGDPSADMVVQEEAQSPDNLGGCRFQLPWEDEDPFAEYDEEVMDGDADTMNSSTTQHSSDTVSDWSDNSMVINL